MADLSKTRENPEDQLWKQIDDVHDGMLGVSGSGQHMQPMAPFADKANNSVWFYTNKTSDLVRAIGSGAEAHLCIVGDDHDYHACLAGTLVVNPDRAKIDEYWSPVVAAWFDNGKDDPNLTMLQLKLKDAAVWASSDSSFRFGWEIAKANLTDSEPDIGVRAHVNFI
ncbi:pyridoxamine 5'-phosphate oxidase family protein [Tepidamorphus sp. 3E244]|uniref:pyridoxamine 5'-phosphate oxidase family protein n=1 Tax=Tepidamorphus sp. 3E244 TaxID=3385498 RepID=UPI0038FC3D4F